MFTNELFKLNPPESNWLYHLKYLFLSLVYSKMTFCDPMKLFDSLHEDPIIKLPLHEQQDSNLFLSNLVDYFNSKYPTLKSLFGGEIHQTVERSGVPEQSNVSFSVIDLNVENENVVKALNAFTEKEVINQTTCKTMLINTAPQILVFNINRMRYGLVNGNYQMIKLYNRFEIPDKINIKNNMFDKTSHEYILNGVIVHSGNANHGHYFSIIKKGDSYIKFDNESGIEITKEEYEKETFGCGESYSHAATLLFYIKSDIKNQKEMIEQTKQNKNIIDLIGKGTNNYYKKQFVFRESTTKLFLHSAAKENPEILFNFFLNIHCHHSSENCLKMNEYSQKFYNIINEKLSKDTNVLKKIFEENSNSFVKFYIGCNIQDLNTKFDKIFRRGIKILKESCGPIINNFINSLNDFINIWKKYNEVFSIVLYFINQNEKCVKYSKTNKWFVKITNLLTRIYSGELSNFILSEIEISNIFEVLIKIVDENDKETIKNILTIKSIKGTKNFNKYSYFLQFAIGKSLLEQYEVCENYPELYPNVNVNELIIQSIFKSNKLIKLIDNQRIPINYEIDYIMNNLQYYRNQIVSFPEFLVYLLTYNDIKINEKGYELYNKLNITNDEDKELLSKMNEKFQNEFNFNPTAFNKVYIKICINKQLEHDGLYQNIKMIIDSNNINYDYLNTIIENYNNKSIVKSAIEKIINNMNKSDDVKKPIEFILRKYPNDLNEFQDLIFNLITKQQEDIDWLSKTKPYLKYMKKYYKYNNLKRLCEIINFISNQNEFDEDLLSDYIDLIYPLISNDCNIGDNDINIENIMDSVEKVNDKNIIINIIEFILLIYALPNYSERIIILSSQKIDENTSNISYIIVYIFNKAFESKCDKIHQIYLLIKRPQDKEIFFKYINQLFDNNKEEIVKFGLSIFNYVSTNDLYIIACQYFFKNVFVSLDDNHLNDFIITNLCSYFTVDISIEPQTLLDNLTKIAFILHCFPAKRELIINRFPPSTYEILKKRLNRMASEESKKQEIWNHIQFFDIYRIQIHILY